MISHIMLEGGSLSVGMVPITPNVRLLTLPDITYIYSSDPLTLGTESGVRGRFRAIRFRKTQGSIESAPRGSQPFHGNTLDSPPSLELVPVPFADRLGEVEGPPIAESEPRVHVCFGRPHSLMRGSIA